MGWLTLGSIAHKILSLCRRGLIIALVSYKKIAKAAIAALVFLQMIWASKRRIPAGNLGIEICQL